MTKNKTSNNARVRRHIRVRKKLRGTADRPRLAVFRSNQHIYAQVIDDDSGKTLVHASDLDPSIKNEKETKASRATHVGQLVAGRAKSAGIASVVFDRGGFLYTGRVAALATAAREGGLEF